MNKKTMHTTIAVALAVGLFIFLFGGVLSPFLRIPIFDLFSRSIFVTQYAVSGNAGEPAAPGGSPVPGFGGESVGRESPETRELLGGLVSIADLKEGSGLEARDGTVISVGYVGTYTDETTGEEIEFDKNLSRERPLSFTLGAGQVIAGFDAGLVGMRENGVRVIVIEPEAGYGDRSAGRIPPNTTLKFIVELYEVR